MKARRAGLEPATSRFRGTSAILLNKTVCLQNRHFGGQLRALLDGRDPSTGEMLRSRAVHVTGWDVTDSPPKSVRRPRPPRVAVELDTGRQIGLPGWYLDAGWSTTATP